MDQQFNIAADTKFIVKDNVLAVICDNPLKTVSSAIFNGGSRQVKAVLNIGVPAGYSDVALHLDPLELVFLSAPKVNVKEDYLAMITAANVHNFSLVTKKSEHYTVHVAATAGCSHGESSGEAIKIEEITGTINIIVFIDGNPAESCMVAALITATEAKSAALRDFDVRSRYSGDSATGSITDSVTVASTGKGRIVSLGGPASDLGQLVGYCTRRAVTEALLKQEPVWGSRSVFDRLKERHLPIEKLAAEISKIDGLAVNAEQLSEILKKKPSDLAMLLAAAKMDEDYKKNLLPTDFKDWNQITGIFASEAGNKKLAGYESVELPPFIKNLLIKIVNTT
ncbi:MAG: adenosylcobinamide amidohydrolase [Candidatus Bathyarchaeia archaeon]